MMNKQERLKLLKKIWRKYKAPVISDWLLRDVVLIQQSIPKDIFATVICKNKKTNNY